MSSTTPTPSLQGSCHCGAVRLTLPHVPDKATRCNCSICRRLGGVWAYYAVGSVVVQGHPEHTEAYIWGDKSLRTIRCKTCGVATHWEPLEPLEPLAPVDAPAPQQPVQHGVNLNNFEPALVQAVPVRLFDGADTWTFLD